MTTSIELARDPKDVKTHIVAWIGEQVDALLTSVDGGASARDLELRVWGIVILFGQGPHGTR